MAEIVVLKGCREDLLLVNIKNFLHPQSYLGSAFEERVRFQRTSGVMNVDTEKGIRKFCVNFIVRLVSELQSRLPKNVKVLRKMSSIAPENCLRRIKDSIIPLCLEMGIPQSMLSDLEFRWQKMNFVGWENVTDTVLFWAEVSKYRDASKENPFRELCNLGKMVLVLPL